MAKALRQMTSSVILIILTAAATGLGCVVSAFVYTFHSMQLFWSWIYELFYFIYDSCLVILDLPASFCVLLHRAVYCTSRSSVTGLNPRV